MLEFVKTGDWALFNILMEDISPTLKRAAIRGEKEVVNTLCDIVKGHLRNQDLGWVALSEAYSHRKVDNPDMILVDRWKYYEAIQVVGQGEVFAVGVRRDRYYASKEGRISIAKVALLHETGGVVWKGSELPARPLWAPSIKEFDEKKGFQKIMVNAIKEGLLKRGWKRVTITTLRKFGAPI